MKLLLIAAAVGLTACASSGDLRQNQPDQVLTSAKPARSASACIHERLEDMISMSKISSRVTETGYTV